MELILYTAMVVVELRWHMGIRTMVVPSYNIPSILNDVVPLIQC